MSSGPRRFVAPVSARLQKTASPGPYRRSQQVVYSIVAKNKGLDPATNVVLTDLLPAGLTYVSDNASTGTYDNTTGLWTIGTLNAGELATLSVNVLINATGQIVNTASIVATETDANTIDNTSSATINVDKVANLTVKKTALPASYQINTNVTYKIRVANAGPDVAKSVVVTDVLPIGLSLVSASATQGTAYNGTTGEWLPGDINPNDSAILTIVARITYIGTITNTATATLN